MIISTRMINKSLCSIVMAVAFCGNCYAEDEGLLAEIKAWRKGMAIPQRLLKFPSERVESQETCSISSYTESVYQYISKIKDDDLLVEIICDRRSNSDIFVSSLGFLIERRGPVWLRDCLDCRRKQMGDSLGEQAEIALQLLRSPFVNIAVARVDYSDVPRDHAAAIMNMFKNDIDRGLDWAAAYAANAARNPDVAKQPCSATVICKLTSGWFSEIGFQMETMTMENRIPLEHLRSLLSKKPGVYLMETKDSLFLYFLKEVYSPRVDPKVVRSGVMGNCADPN